MAIKSILFNKQISTEMIRAILDGRKSCTRRLVNPQPKSKLCYTFAGSDSGTWRYPNRTAHEIWGEEFKLPNDITEEELSKRWNPPYHTDDILYVRETWCAVGKDTEENVGFLPGEQYLYKADDFGLASIKRWHPSIHMPKEAARIWLKVTDVKVERLQELTEDGANIEGMPDDLDYPVSKIYCPICKGYGTIDSRNPSSLGHEEIDCPNCDSRRKRFANLWNATIKKQYNIHSWDANPYVWVIEFERCEKLEGV